MFSKENVIGIVEKNPFCEYIGLEVLDVKEGYTLGRVRLREEHKNLYGGMHGGCSYSIADTVGGIAATSYGDMVTTASSSMNYLLPVKDTKYVYCEADVIRHGHKLSVVHVTIQDDDRTILMDGSFTYYTLHEIEQKKNA